jgi:hypothetical protein
VRSLGNEAETVAIIQRGRGTRAARLMHLIADSIGLFAPYLN